MADEKNPTTAADTKALAVAQAPAEMPKPTPAAQKPSKQPPVVAVNRIDGDIEPGTMFRPATKQDRLDLEALGAVRELTEAEQALFDRGDTVATDEDPLG